MATISPIPAKAMTLRYGPNYRNFGDEYTGFSLLIPRWPYAEIQGASRIEVTPRVMNEIRQLLRRYHFLAVYWHRRNERGEFHTELFSLYPLKGNIMQEINDLETAIADLASVADSKGDSHIAALARGLMRPHHKASADPSGSNVGDVIVGVGHLIRQEEASTDPDVISAAKTVLNRLGAVLVATT